MCNAKLESDEFCQFSAKRPDQIREHYISMHNPRLASKTTSRSLRRENPEQPPSETCPTCNEKQESDDNLEGVKSYEGICKHVRDCALDTDEYKYTSASLPQNPVHGKKRVA